MLLASISAVFGANNPADLTCSYRVCPVRFVKGIYDAGPWSAMVVQPIGDRSSALLWSWNSEDGKTGLVEASVTTKLTDLVQVGFVHDDWHGADDNDSAMLDLSVKGAGLGILVPVGEHTDKILLGPRASAGNFTGYATIAESASPLFGLNWSKDRLSLDATVGSNDSWWFRASRPFCHGKETIIPELRLRGSKGETHIGFGVGMCY